jgi:hypothetical protein
MTGVDTEIYFTRSAYWGSDVWFAHVSGRDLGRVARCSRFGACCTGWHGWPDQYPASGNDPDANKPTVRGARTRRHAAELLRDRADHPEEFRDV